MSATTDKHVNPYGSTAEAPYTVVVSPEQAGWVYSSGPGRGIDVHTEIGTGDVVLVPYGYHGPSMAAPGYDLYYLNVMAGPAQERAWLFCDDPAHAWIRDTWVDLDVDPRLPLTSAGGHA